MAVRTQITLDAEAHRSAKRRAADMGISLAEYVRRLIARDLGEPPTGAEVSAIFGLGRSDGSDVARHKDRYQGEAVDADRSRRRPASAA